MALMILLASFVLHSAIQDEIIQEAKVQNRDQKDDQTGAEYVQKLGEVHRSTSEC